MALVIILRIAGENEETDWGSVYAGGMKRGGDGNRVRGKRKEGFRDYVRCWLEQVADIVYCCRMLEAFDLINTMK